jgi:hypothetical protein
MYRRKLHRFEFMVKVLMPEFNVVAVDAFCRMKVADVKSKIAPATLNIRP